MSFLSCLNYIPVINHREEGNDDARDEAHTHLQQSVLTQYHPARTYQSCHEEEQEEPPCGVEGEEERECYHATYHPTYCRRVRGNLPAKVYQRTNHLHGKCRHYHRSNEMRHVQQVYDVVTHEVAHNTYYVRHHSPLLLSELYRCPSVIILVYLDEVGRDNGREEIDYQQHAHLYPSFEHTKICEHEQRYYAEHGQIER